MGFSLAPTAAAQGYRLETFETIGSTNAAALDRARQGDSGRLWLVSKHQTSGRGRRGRAWATEPGNLAATLLLVPEFELARSATLGFVAGLALADALDAVVPAARIPAFGEGQKTRNSVRFELKWPNDVLANGKKLSGILLESAMLDRDRYALAIGIGVNVTTSPEDVPYPVTSLSALGADCDAETLFLALSDAWVANVAAWQSGQGLATVRKRWLERAAGLGGEVAVRLDDRVVKGIFETIDDECRFIVRAADGQAVAIAAGDVHFGAVASVGA